MLSYDNQPTLRMSTPNQTQKKEEKKTQTTKTKPHNDCLKFNGMRETLHFLTLLLPVSLSVSLFPPSLSLSVPISHSSNLQPHSYSSIRSTSLDRFCISKVCLFNFVLLLLC